jgi:hypothetical protein
LLWLDLITICIFCTRKTNKNYCRLYKRGIHCYVSLWMLITILENSLNQNKVHVARLNLISWPCSPVVCNTFSYPTLHFAGFWFQLCFMSGATLRWNSTGRRELLLPAKNNESYLTKRRNLYKSVLWIFNNFFFLLIRLLEKSILAEITYIWYCRWSKNKYVWKEVVHSNPTAKCSSRHQTCLVLSAKLSQTVLNTVLELQALFRHDLQGLKEIYGTGNVADKLRPEGGCQCTCNLQRYSARLASTSYCQTITLHRHLPSRLRENMHIRRITEY